MEDGSRDFVCLVWLWPSQAWGIDGGATFVAMGFDGAEEAPNRHSYNRPPQSFWLHDAVTTSSFDEYEMPQMRELICVLCINFSCRRFVAGVALLLSRFVSMLLDGGTS